MPIVVPMTGTFRLQFLDQNPLVARYQLQDISFHAGTKGGAEYWVTGTGTYQVGGEVAVAQDIFLDLQIANSFEKYYTKQPTLILQTIFNLICHYIKRINSFFPTPMLF